MDAFPKPILVDLEPPDKASEVCLTLVVQDREVVDALLEHAEEQERTRFALRALRLGVLAMRTAQGALDQKAVQEAADRMIVDVKNLLEGNANLLSNQLTTSLTEYFDPETGRLVERLNGFIKDDGELSRVLKFHVDGEACSLARTLAAQIGENSPLMKMLSPEQKGGLLAKIEEKVKDLLTKEQETITKEFSLDDPASALSRFLQNIKGANGELRTDLSKDLKKVTDEFSKDNDASLISKLLKQMGETHSTVRDSLTLNSPESPLSVLRRELNETIKDLLEKSADFQTKVVATLEAMKARKEEAAKGTQHGVEFEDAVGAVVREECSQLNDRFETTKNTGGRISGKAKVGDHVITLGKECAAAGGRIVVECKEVAGYTEAKALVELEEARKNRDAQIGIFVFSRRTAPEGLPPFARHGNDIILIWDQEDRLTDLYLNAAVSVARALVVKHRVAAEQTSEDIAEIDNAILLIEKMIEKSAKIKTWATTIRNNGDSIIKEAEKIEDVLREQVDALRNSVDRLRLEASQEE